MLVYCCMIEARGVLVFQETAQIVYSYLTFLLAEIQCTLTKQRQTFTTQNTYRHCRVRFCETKFCLNSCMSPASFLSLERNQKESNN